jgi:hypothetical protein
MSTQDRFYEIDFTDGNNVETLRYQIIDSPVADAWWNIVEGALSEECHCISSNQWIQKSPTDTINLLWERMKLLVDEINTGNYGHTEQLFMPAEFDSSVDHSKLLNYLHLQFHKFEEQKQDHSLECPPLSELNLIIHKIEAVLQDGPMSCGFHLEWNYSAVVPRVIDIEDMELYQHWTSLRKFGALMLGYHTIGKNLWMCYKDNDADLVKTGMFRQQKTISSEVNLIFRSNTRNITNHGNFLLMCKWLEDNNLMQYVDMSNPCNCAIGQPLLGKLIGTYTPVNIGHILSLGRVGDVRLI